MTNNFLRKAVLATTAGLALMLGSGVANATILGFWTGDWSGSGITADFDFTVDTETGTGFTGFFDWTCTTGISCSGREFVAGTLTDSSLVFATTGFLDPVNLGPSSYTATLIDFFTIQSTGTQAGTWTATRVSEAGVPEPGTLALLGLGLVGLGFAKRRKLN